MKRRKAIQKMCNHLSSALQRAYEANLDPKLINELKSYRDKIEALDEKGKRR